MSGFVGGRCCWIKRAVFVQSERRRTQIMTMTESDNRVWIPAHGGNRHRWNVNSEQVDAADFDPGIWVKEILNAGVAQRKISVSQPDRAHLAAFQQVEAGGPHDRLQARQIKLGEIRRQQNYGAWRYRLADAHPSH